MALYLVRHGETDWNRAGRLQSTTDVPLNARGRRQAERLRAALAARGVRFAAARTSPLARALETARIVLAGAAVPLAIDPRLVEVALGEFEGEREEDLRARLGAAFDAWRTRLFTEPAPGGEPFASARARAAAVLAELGCPTGDVPGDVAGDLLIVGHQGINLALVATLAELDDPAVLAGLRQGNDEVEVWDPAERKRIERFRISDEE